MAMHVVPTHLNTSETVLAVAGLSLSVRQFLILLFGLAGGFQGYQLLIPWPDGSLWILARLALVAVPIGAGLALAFARPGGRHLELWALVVLRYLQRPHCLVWRSIRHSEPQAASGLVSEKQEAT